MKDKLKKIVEKMMAGGVKPADLFPIHKDAKEVKFSFDSFDIQELIDGRIAIFFMLNCESKGKTWFQPQDDHSYPDLITNPAAMGALFGEGLVCSDCSMDECPFEDNEAACPISKTPNFVVHGKIAYKLLLTQGQQQSIEYIWKECGE